MLGMHGSAYANLAMQKADVIIALGARFDDRITEMDDTASTGCGRRTRSGRKAADVTRDPVVEAGTKSDDDVQGDVADSMRKLLSFLPEESDERAGWFAKIQQWKGDAVRLPLLPPRSPSRTPHTTCPSSR
jgi:acetolactate synthase-1/2/3 large subunit